MYLGKLKSLKQENDDNITKLCEMIDHWKNKSSNATWKDIIVALESRTVECNRTAQEIKDFLKKPNTLKKYSIIN